MIIAIHQPQYLPWLGYFDKIHLVDQFILLDNVQFKKNEWQNRNRIRTAQGWQWLTVPVIHHFGQNISEVPINNNTNWSKNHLTAIQQNYSKSAHFNEYFDIIKDVYEQTWEALGDINIEMIMCLVKILGISTKIIKSSDIPTEGTSTDRLIELCEYCGADQYLAGIDGEKYMDFDKFKAHNIEVITQDFKHPVYNQMWTNKEEGFISHLSIIDLIFNHGNKSLNILKQQNIDGKVC